MRGCFWTTVGSVLEATWVRDSAGFTSAQGGIVYPKLWQHYLVESLLHRKTHLCSSVCVWEGAGQVGQVLSYIYSLKSPTNWEDIRCVCMFLCACVSRSVMPDFATPWTIALQAPLSVEFSRQEHWSWLSFPSPGDPPNPGIEPGYPALQTDSLQSEPPRKVL